MNQLEMNHQQSIVGLHRNGWSNRRIARELQLDRETVGRYVRLHLEVSKPAKVPAGSEPPESSKPANPPAGSETPSQSASSGEKAERTRSQCEKWRGPIEEGRQAGLTAQRIYQDLVSEQAFAGSYDSVKRFVRQLEGANPLPFRRMECEPGQEVQVDFGRGAWVIQDGKRRRPHLFRMVLSHSRKGYSEVVWRQTTETFIRCLENGFRSYGGVTKTTVLDNLKAAILKADWYDPTVHPKLLSFCEHYHTAVLPTKPATPRHKGKIEAGVKFVQNNALKGRSFESLAQQNQFLSEWEVRVADTRIHGTVRQQVAARFAQSEKTRLLPLPAMLFPCFEEARRSVHLDGHVEVDKTYYSVPPEYVRSQVWARWDGGMVRIFNERMESIAVHARGEPGRFRTDEAHIHSRKRALVENGLDYLLERTERIGLQAWQWAQAMAGQRGPQAIRTLQGFLQWAAKHSHAQVEQAAQRALEHGVWHLRDLKALLGPVLLQEPLPFLESHPLIRPLSEYQDLLPDCFEPAEPKASGSAPDPNFPIP